MLIEKLKSRFLDAITPGDTSRGEEVVIIPRERASEVFNLLRQPNVAKPLAIAYGTGELPPLVSDSRALHASRSGEHLPGALIPVAGADHFTITHELRDADGELTRQLLLLA